MKTTIKKIAEQHIVESVVKNVTNNSKDEDLKDLCQDVYLTLMEKDEELIKSIYDREQITYYITRIVINNIKSRTSRFYYLYKKNKSEQTSLEDAAEKGQREKYDNEE